MKKVVAVLSLIVGAKCTWEDPFLTVSDSTKFIFTPDRDVAGNIKYHQRGCLIDLQLLLRQNHHTRVSSDWSK